MSLDIDEECFVFQDSRSFCTNEDYELRYFINGQQVLDIRSYEIEEDDRVLISYGAEIPREIEGQLDELEKQQIIK